MKPAGYGEASVDGQHVIFVYGTLKRGYSNNERLLYEAKFLGTAVSKSACYAMCNVGFPFLWDAPNGAMVKGELFLVDDATLSRCDRLEGHPRWYQRKERQFIPMSPNGELFSAAVTTAWIYLRGGDPHEGIKVKPVKGVIEWKPRS